jgi:hypothetical protein
MWPLPEASALQLRDIFRTRLHLVEFLNEIATVFHPNAYEEHPKPQHIAKQPQLRRNQWRASRLVDSRPNRNFLVTKKEKGGGKKKNPLKCITVGSGIMRTLACSPVCLMFEIQKPWKYEKMVQSEEHYAPAVERCGPTHMEAGDALGMLGCKPRPWRQCRSFAIANLRYLAARLDWYPAASWFSPLLSVVHPPRCCQLGFLWKFFCRKKAISPTRRKISPTLHRLVHFPPAQETNPFQIHSLTGIQTPKWSHRAQEWVAMHEKKNHHTKAWFREEEPLQYLHSLSYLHISPNHVDERTTLPCVSDSYCASKCDVGARK